MLIILIAVLVFTYGLYIFYYPYIYTDAFSKKGQNQCLGAVWRGCDCNAFQVLRCLSFGTMILIVL